MTTTPPTNATPDTPEQQREQVRQLLERRFRHHFRTGQLSPLLHLLMRYKLESLA